jgi:hypothetical protein
VIARHPLAGEGLAGATSLGESDQIHADHLGSYESFPLKSKWKSKLSPRKLMLA